MAQKLLILGPSGTGKSYAVQFLDPKETFVIAPDKKELPFRGSTKKYITVFDEKGVPKYSQSNWAETNSMKNIHELIKLIALKRPEIKNIVVDTITHAMIKSVMRELTNESWNKWKQFATEFYDLTELIPQLRKDLMIVFNAHVEITDTPNGDKVSFKVAGGKLTKEVIDPESLFSIVLGSECQVVDGKSKFFFVTQNNGLNTCKSPEGMFPDLHIENNLQYVRDCIFAYYNEDDAPQAKVVKIEDQF